MTVGTDGPGQVSDTAASRPDQDPAAGYTRRADQRRYIRYARAALVRARHPLGLAPALPRPLPLLLLLLLISLAVAFGLGAIPGLLRSGGPAGTFAVPKVTVATTSGPGAARTGPLGGPGPFTAVAGYGCPNTPAATFAIYGWRSTGLTGFFRVPGGGPSGDGCNGSFAAMPMSGSASLDDPADYALWTFRTGAVRQNLCNISVFIPNDGSIEHVAGDPAYYQVFGSASASGAAVGSFYVNQPAILGQWAAAGTYRVTGGAITVRLYSRGVSQAGATMTFAHVAVSAIQVGCQA